DVSACRRVGRQRSVCVPSLTRSIGFESLLKAELAAYSSGTQDRGAFTDPVLRKRGAETEKTDAITAVASGGGKVGGGGGGGGGMSTSFVVVSGARVGDLSAGA
ncbi:unnamed protein product, partial [Pylaiella littoralis]